MQIKTDENGVLKLYTDHDVELDLKYIKGISIDTGKSSEVQPLTACVEIYLSNLDIVGNCKGLDQDVSLFTVCPSCAKKRTDCLCDEKQTVVSNLTLAVRDENGKGFGYVEQAIVETALGGSKPIITIYKYEKDKDGNIRKGVDGKPELFKYYSK